MLPSSQEIKGFIEIARCSNITQAAQRLGMTQPSLSQSLKKLEHTVGEQLVLRSKNGVELTVAGKQFLSQAQQLMDLWQNLKTKTKSSTSEVRGLVRLGCHPSVALYSLDLFLPSIIRNYSDLEITLVHDLSRKIVDQVLNFEVDIGLVINPLRHADLIMHRIFEDEVKIWQTSDSVNDVLICDPELLQTQSLLKKIKKNRLQYNRVLTSKSLEVITQLTKSGCGHGIIPYRVTTTFNDDRKLKPVPNSPSFKDELYLIYRTENKNIEALRKIKESIILNLKA